MRTSSGLCRTGGRPQIYEHTLTHSAAPWRPVAARSIQHTSTSGPRGHSPVPIRWIRYSPTIRFPLSTMETKRRRRSPSRGHPAKRLESDSETRQLVAVAASAAMRRPAHLSQTLTRAVRTDLNTQAAAPEAVFAPEAQPGCTFRITVPNALSKRDTSAARACPVVATVEISNGRPSQDTA